MPTGTINFDTVRKIGLTLPGVEASPAWGAPALKVCGKLLACVPTHHSAEPRSFMVRVDFDDRAELLAAAPDVPFAIAQPTQVCLILAGFRAIRERQSFYCYDRH
jgi:hypothetical protein